MNEKTAPGDGSIYIMISSTCTGFAKVVRRFGHTKYNHAAVSLDPELRELYAFARPQHNALLVGRLMRENVYRYTLGKNDNVAVVIYRLKLTMEQYEQVRAAVIDIYNDPEYMYNLFSVLSYPFTGGFSTYKAFSCIEFAMYILKLSGFPLEKPICKYRPDDLLTIMEDYKFFDGNLLDYTPDRTVDTGYFAPMTGAIIRASFKNLGTLIRRLFMKRK